MRNRIFQRLVSTIANCLLFVTMTFGQCSYMYASQTSKKLEKALMTGVNINLLQEQASKVVECASTASVKVEVVSFTPPKTTMQEYIEVGPTEQEIVEFNNQDIHSMYSSGYYMVLNRNFDRLSEYEFDLLCRIINAEARGESDEAQQAVGQVVLNRIDSDTFPNDMHSVIYQKNQFTPTMDGQINLEPEPRVIENAKKVLIERWLPSNALFFTSSSYGFFKKYKRYKQIDHTCISLYGDVIYEDEK